MTEPFRLAVLRHAQGYADAHIREQGANRGPMIEHFQRANGGEVGESWCADFVCTCMMEAMFERHPENAGDFKGARRWVGLNYVRCSPSVAEMAQDAMSRGVFRDKDWKATPGSLVCFRWENGHHHIGVVKWDFGPVLKTIEGNTSSGNEGSQSVGDGVYERHRMAEYVMGFIDLGDS